MKKYITITILIFAINCQESNNTNPESSPGTPSGSPSTEIDEKSSQDTQDVGQSLILTKEILEKNKWDSDSDDGDGQKLSFQQGKAEYEKPAFEDLSRFYSGTYTIQNNQLEISYQTMKYMDEVETDSSKMTCSYSIAKRSLNYNEKLECQHDFDPDVPPVSFYNLSSKLKEGDSRTIDSTEVTIFRKTFASTVDSLMVRSSPSAKAEPVQWIDDAKYDPPRTSLKKGEKVKIIAITKEKMDVGKMNNYWYYVEIPAVGADHPVFYYQSGWVFGEFLK